MISDNNKSITHTHDAIKRFLKMQCAYCLAKPGTSSLLGPVRSPLSRMDGMYSERGYYLIKALPS